MRAALDACARKLSATFDQTVLYEPASRYGPFQWVELAALALALAALSAWWIRPRFA